MNGVRGYIDEGEVIKVENCRRKCGKDEGKTRTARNGILKTRIVRLRKELIAKSRDKTRFED